MRNAYLRSFLTIIVLLQSFSAVADMHLFHPSSSQHDMLVEHLHDPHAVETVEATDQHNDALDCDHCCHCHSAASSLLPTTLTSIWPVNNPVAKSIYSRLYSSKIATLLYRPPIA